MGFSSSTKNIVVFLKEKGLMGKLTSLWQLMKLLKTRFLTTGQIMSPRIFTIIEMDIMRFSLKITKIETRFVGQVPI